MKHISIYKTELPSQQHFERLLLDSQRLTDEGEEKIALLCPPCSENGVSSFGFHPTHPILKTASGFCLQFKSEVKSIPKKLIDQLVEKKIEAIKLDDPDFYLTKKNKQQIREEVFGELVRQTIAVSSYIKAFYHAESGKLIIDSSTDSTTGTILAFLRRMLGSLKTTTLHVDGVSNGLTQNIKTNIDQDKGLGFKGFSFGNTLNLENIEKSKANFNGDYELETIRELIEQGYSVVKVQLQRDGLTFILTDALKITGIILDDTLASDLEKQVIEEYGEGEVDTQLIKQETKFLEEQTQVELLVGISDDLVEFFSELINAEEAA